ncbi:helix-turn-helix domain-containing protein [Ophiocordyceps camponoti-floridani]|uniref:Helix-turn-helix domain-containing protein n=1 Tax=Ophiocordyceps camponoti-floridani TaxID=2030778 RepID=A0A8H4VF47_9HYPO|nr:helix-turn-helix domain-containing protein [Ophiocordyceps camponoti-floridani]
MVYTLYDASIAVAIDALASLTAVLKKAQESPNAARFSEARLAEDMLPLAFQVHVMTDLAQKLYHRLAGQEPLKWENSLKDYEQMHGRIAQTEELLSKANKEEVNKHDGETVSVGLGPGKTADMTTTAYVNGYILPNIFFHLTTAYAILRKEGVQLGKMDYLRPFIGKYVKDV